MGLVWALSTAVVLGGVTKPFPAHWGQPPKIQTSDFVRLPGGYGQGSSTLAAWIAARMESDQAAGTIGRTSAPAVVYAQDFEQADGNRLPEGFLVLNGAFVVRSADNNRFLEGPDAPADDYALLFGPAGKDGLAVSARLHGTRRGRRMPVLAVGLNGLGGYELQLAPAKRALELFKGDERVASVPCGWESGTWTRMRLQVRKVSATQWKIEGKAWKQDTPEPDSWMIAFDESKEPPLGRPLISGHPISGTPIRFDDLVVARVP